MVLSCKSAFFRYIGCLIILIVGQNIPAVHAEVTLAGGGKTYGGVFVGGGGVGDDIFWEITKAYDTRLLNLPNSGWTAQNMVGLGLSAATKNAVKAGIDRFKPGGATPLQPGDEFQFYFVGHARIGQDPLGKTRYEFGLADGVVTMDRMPYDPPESSCLGEWLSGFPPSVTISVILVTCHSKTGAEILRDEIKDSEENSLDSNHLCIGYSCDWIGNVLWPWGNPKRSGFTEELIKGIENAVQSSGKAITKDVIKNSVAPALKEKNTGDNDGDGEIDEDAAVPGGTPGEDAMRYDDDGDGLIDEDPFPQEAGYFEGSTGFSEVTDHDPEYGETVLDGSLTLSWTNLDPVPPATSVWVDVWFGTDPYQDPNGVYADFNKIVDAGLNVTSIGTSTVPGTYYWQVDSYIYGDPATTDYTGSNPNFPIIEGFVMYFYATDDLPPTVVIDTLPTATWANEPVQLDATVTDDSTSPVTYLWTSDEPNAVFSPSTVEDTTVTVNYHSGPFTVTLTVSDDINPNAHSDTLGLDCADNPCQAARNVIGLAANYPSDFDGNCIINLGDFAAEIAAKWLEDYTLTVPEVMP